MFPLYPFNIIIHIKLYKTYITFKVIRGNMSVAKSVSGKKIKECFLAAIEDDKEYTLDDTKKAAVAAFKDALKLGQGKKRAVKVDGDGVVIKKAPSKYNLYIKDEMARLIKENPEKERKELMKLAAINWNESKAAAVAVAATDGSGSDVAAAAAE
jgi:hypothetical protein